MSSVPNSVETVSAAATAIVTAESRVQPSSVPKRRWGGCWSIYWCFGSYKHNKRIGHAVLVSEPAAPGVVAQISETRSHTSTIVLPFIAPPSSPASFLQSDPPSATQSPASLAVHAHAPGGTEPMYTVGPYAHETQLVSPPVFSTFTTEPSTACFTPPPEAVQMTTPSSPEVPFAHLLSSSLAGNRRNSGTNLKYNLFQYEFQPYQYPGSPRGHIKSPGSAVSTSGTSSPFPDKRPVMGFRAGEAPKFVGYEHFRNYRWDSRVGSGSLTPNGWGSRLGSGALTPSGGEPPSRDGNQMYEIASLGSTENKSQNDDVVADHRVSFELFGEDIPSCVVREPTPWHQHRSADPEEGITETRNADRSCREELNPRDSASEGEGEEIHQKHRTMSVGWSKEFNFNNEEIVRKELGAGNRWSFFPMLQSGAS